MMQVPFALCCLVTTIAAGLALECEICGIGGPCNGAMRTCHSKYTNCSITLLEITGKKNVHGIIKNCINSTLCDVGLGIVNMGPAGLIQSNLICCVGDECKTSPTLPWRNTTSNGKVCPACFAMEKSCKEGHVSCAGDEIYCIEGAGAGITQTGRGTSDPNFIIKGCATKGACEELQADSVILPWATKESWYSCTAAPEESSILQPGGLNSNAARKTPEDASKDGAATTVSDFFGTFLPILAMKVFL